jgi:spore cortex protein
LKKISILPASLLLILSLVGCANNDNTNNSNGNKTNDQTNTAENTGAGKSADGTNDANNNNDTNGNGQWNVEVADDVAERISKMDEVENAYVLVTDESAFVGAVLKENVTENDDLKSKIADEVRKDNSNFNNVYVSFNPDVAARLTEYADQIRAGEPIEGFIEEFTTGINRMFPESKYSPGASQGLGKRDGQLYAWPSLTFVTNL